MTCWWQVPASSRGTQDVDFVGKPSKVDVCVGMGRKDSFIFLKHG
jgi:hypothetical protein